MQAPTLRSAAPSSHSQTYVQMVKKGYSTQKSFWKLMIFMCFVFMTWGSLLFHVRPGARTRADAVLQDLPQEHALRGPNLASPPRPRTTMTWHDQEIPLDEEWDFYGLKVPLSSALSRAKKGQIGSDYDLGKVNGSEVPQGYDAPKTSEPALQYPAQNDRLFVTASTRPRVLFFPQILTDEEADAIIKIAEPHLKRSQVAVTTAGAKQNQSSTQEARTSKSTWVDLAGSLANVNKRLCSIVGSTWHEPMNVLHYGVSQHYDSHHDYFDPNYYGSQANNRMATFYLYLSDTPDGGATTIPRANGGSSPPNFGKAACQQGLQVYPRKGSGVLFYNMRPDRTLDPFSLHGACDVEDGEKWGGPVWFRANTPAGTGRSRER